MADEDDSGEIVARIPKRRPRGYWSPGTGSNPNDPPPIVRIYVILCGVYVKVGIAADIHKRLASFLCDNPYDTRVLCTRTIRADAAHLAERRAHDLLDAWHHRGEWFTCSPEDARKAVNRAVDSLKYKILPWDEWRIEDAERRERIRAHFEEMEGAEPVDNLVM